MWSTAKFRYSDRTAIINNPKPPWDITDSKSVEALLHIIVPVNQTAEEEEERNPGYAIKAFLPKCFN